MKTKIQKVRKTFQYDGIDLRIVDIEEPYMNASVLMTRVLAPNNGRVPVKINRNQSLKSIVSDTIIVLDGLKERGADMNELTNQL